MIPSRTFEKQPGADDSRPLNECHRWALEHCAQAPDLEQMRPKVITPMLLVVEQYTSEGVKKKASEVPVYRRYYATTIDSFVGFYNNVGISDAQRHCDEVIGFGPCKAFCDFEVELSAANARALGFASVEQLSQAAEESTRALIAAIVQYHFEAHHVRVEPIVLAAHKPSKWSKHVVFRHSLWRDVKHLGRYMVHQCAQLAANYPLLAKENKLVDQGVYGYRRCLRMYRSSKLTEPNRSFRYESGPPEYDWYIGEPPTRSISRALLLDTLVTAIPLPRPPKPMRVGEEASTEAAEPDADGEPPHVTTTFLEKFQQIAHIVGLRPLEFETHEDTASAFSSEDTLSRFDNSLDLSDELCDALAVEFARLQPYKVAMSNEMGVARISCKSRNCDFIGRDHKSREVFVLINLIRRSFAIHCTDDVCFRKPRRWQRLPPEPFEPLLDALLESWPFMQPLGSLSAVCNLKTTEIE